MPDRNLSPTFYADLVGHIYESAFSPEHWRDVVDALCELYPDGRIALFAHRDGRPVEGMTVNRNFPDDALRAYIAYYAANSPYLAHAKRLVVGRPAYGEETVPHEELVRSEHYNDFTRPFRLGSYATGVVAERDGNGMVALSIADHKDDQRRRAHQHRLLGIIAPHVVRAMRLRRSVIARETTATTLETAFNSWAHAAFVINAEGCVISLNRAAQSLLEIDDGIALTGKGQLQSYDDKVTRELQSMIRSALLLTDRCDFGCSDKDRNGIVLPRRARETSLHAIAWPLPHHNTPDFGVPRGRVLVVVFEPGLTLQNNIGWLAQRFGLSTAERALLQAIVDGVTLAEAAEHLGIEVSSARTRLKTIQSKTGCRRQVELVRLALSMPAIRQH